MSREEVAHVGRHPGGHVHAVGDGLHRHPVDRPIGPHRLPHLAGDVAVELADRVDAAGGAHGQGRHVELRAVPVVVLAQGQEAGAVLAEFAPAAGQVFLDQVEGEGVVTGRHRRVRGEDRALAHHRERLVERHARLDVLADALQHDEGGVAFVEMPDRRLDAHGPQHPHAADAEDHFLLDARFAVAAVEAGREFAVPRRVFLEVGVEQVEAHVADPDPPHRGQHRAIAERHGGDARPAVGGDGGFNRRVGPVDALVVFLLPAVVRHALVEVALRIHEAHADERQAEVAGFLAVIAGQHAQTAGVDGQRLVQGELGGEVGNHLALDVGAVGLEPRLLGLTRRVEIDDDGIVEAHELGVVRGPLQRVGAEGAQHPGGVVGRRPPHREIQAAEQGRARLAASSTRRRWRVRRCGGCGPERGGQNVP